MSDSDFCDLIKFKRVTKDGVTLLQITFWRGAVQLPYTALIEIRYARNYVREDNPTDYLYAKVRPFSEEFKTRLATSRAPHDYASRLGENRSGRFCSTSGSFLAVRRRLVLRFK